MANDAFALSPISASSALPSEADYHAISEAFMETSRGRWFLKEYARRNRNADTAMVLEAVERIEGVLAAQKQPPAAPAIPVAETIATVRAIVETARGAAAEALASLNAEDARAPTRKGLRIILEIAWRLREIGYDNRICDILEVQANTIGANQDALATLQANDAVLGAFDAILRQIGDIAEPRAAQPSAPETPAPHPVAENVVSLKTAAPAAAPMARAAPAQSEPSPAPLMPAAEGIAAIEIASDLEVADAPVAGVAADAAEMAAAGYAGIIVADEDAEPGATAASAPVVAPVAIAGPAMVAADIEAVSPPAAHTAAAAPPQSAMPALAVAAIASAPAVAAEPPPAAASPSLGDALLARGMVTATTRPQPLAAILRMSQAEKIAFFS